MLTTQNEAINLSGELEQIVASIFQTMLGLDLQPAADVRDEERRETATVHFSGSWSGLLMLEVSPPVACRLAARFLSSEVPHEVDGDVRDVLGELANMIGGNLKCILAPGAVLSIPEVFGGRDCSFRVCGGAAPERQAFACDDGIFWVSLIQTPHRAS